METDFIMRGILALKNGIRHLHSSQVTIFIVSVLKVMRDLYREYVFLCFCHSSILSLYILRSVAIITGAFTFCRRKTSGFSVELWTVTKHFLQYGSLHFPLTVYLLSYVFVRVQNTICALFQMTSVPCEWRLNQYPYSIYLFNVPLCVWSTPGTCCTALFVIVSRGVYPYLPLATNAPTTVWGDFIKVLTNFSIQKSI